MQFKQTPNFTKGRGIPKIGIVWHGTLGNYGGAVNWLCTPPEQRNPVSYSSAHYVIGKKEGQSIQLVKNEDVSWHSGIVYEPNERAKSLLPVGNPNDYFIGVEFEWFPGEPLTEWQYQEAIRLVKESGIKNPIFLSHKEITSYKADDMLFAVKEIEKRLTNTLGEVKKKLAELTILINNL